MRNRLLPTLLLSLIAVLFVSGLAYSMGLEVIDHRTEQEGLFNNAVTAVSPADETGVFIASRGGLHILLDYFFLPIFQNIPALAIAPDPDGDLWAAAAGGLIYHVVEHDGIWSAVRIPFEKKKITALAAGHAAVTVGTDSGLYYYDDSDTEFHEIIKEGAFTALAEPADGTIIAGCRDRAHKKGGLVIIGGTFASRTGWVDELAGKDISALLVYNDRLLIGTRSDGAFVMDTTGVAALSLPGDPGAIKALLVQDGITLIAADKGLYGATAGGPFESLSASGGAAPSDVTCLAPGPGGAVWVGTGKDGIYLIRVRP